MKKAAKPNVLQPLVSGSLGKMMMGNGKNTYFCRDHAWNSYLDFTYKASIGNAEKSYELPKEIEYNAKAHGEACVHADPVQRFVM